MLRRMLLICTLAFLFGLGQQGAAMHAISHYADTQEQQQDKKHATSACEKCVVYAELAGAVPSAAYTLPSCAEIHAVTAIHNASAHSLSRLAYSARAPPLLV